MTTNKKHRGLIRLALLAVAAALLAQPAVAQLKLPAFPGAEGFGAFAQGGRGGKVYLVTTLDDSGPGSLRDACEAEGPRIVVFKIGGIIDLDTSIAITQPFITIAGQTAPGDGICLRGESLKVAETHDVIVRHLRSRPGDIKGHELDGISVSQTSNAIFDHCSVSWAIDELFSVNSNCKDVTVQWCIISEALHDSIHHKGRHGYGSLISSYDGGITMHHNLYAHNSSRNPRGGGRDDLPGVRLDFRNNVIYDWGFRAGYSGHENVHINYIDNYLKPGPSTHPDFDTLAWHMADTRNKIFLSGNIIEGAPEKNEDNWLMIEAARPFKEIPGENPPVFEQGTLDECRMDAPFDAPPITATTAGEAFSHVLARVGAILPRRDEVDARVIRQVQTGTGRQIDSQSEVGGWPEYKGADAPLDTDSDGMPDAWEKANGLAPSDPTDSAADPDADGYTNIEEYINSITTIQSAE